MGKIRGGEAVAHIEADIEAAMPTGCEQFGMVVEFIEELMAEIVAHGPLKIPLHRQAGNKGEKSAQHSWCEEVLICHGNFVLMLVAGEGDGVWMVAKDGGKRIGYLLVKCIHKNKPVKFRGVPLPT